MYNPSFILCYETLENDCINNTQTPHRYFTFKETDLKGMKSDEDIIRDVIQNHLLQVLSLVAMEAPSDIRKAESVTSEKVKLLDSIRVVRPEHVVLGQCGDEKEKAPTFATVVLYVDNPRWSGVRGVVFERSVRARSARI